MTGVASCDRDADTVRERMKMKPVPTPRPLRLSDDPDREILPADAWQSIKEFALAKKTGNLTLNFKNGVILGARVEEFVAFNLFPNGRNGTS